MNSETLRKKTILLKIVMSRKGGSECNPSCRVGYVPSSQVYASSSNLISFLKEIFFDNCSFVFADLQALGNRTFTNNNKKDFPDFIRLTQYL